jgi:phospholipase/lecithinase/hemolysin
MLPAAAIVIHSEFPDLVSRTCKLTVDSGTATPDTFNDVCGIPVNQYFWLDLAHPTSPMHEVIAEQVAKTLDTGPGICGFQNAATSARAPAKRWCLVSVLLYLRIVSWRVNYD